MQTEEQKTVDIDTSGPDAEIELKDDVNESEAVESTEDTSPESVATEATSNAPQEASEEKKDTKKEQRRLNYRIRRTYRKLD